MLLVPASCQLFPPRLIAPAIHCKELFLQHWTAATNSSTIPQFARLLLWVVHSGDLESANFSSVIVPFGYSLGPDLSSVCTVHEGGNLLLLLRVCSVEGVVSSFLCPSPTVLRPWLHVFFPSVCHPFLQLSLTPVSIYSIFPVVPFARYPCVVLLGPLFHFPVYNFSHVVTHGQFSNGASLDLDAPEHDSTLNAAQQFHHADWCRQKITNHTKVNANCSHTDGSPSPLRVSSVGLFLNHATLHEASNHIKSSWMMSQTK